MSHTVLMDFGMNSIKIARKLIFSKWKEGLGNLELMVSGSAALQTRLARIFAAAEISNGRLWFNRNFASYLCKRS
jgi:long-subunit acyl-CoA synthetase (AMP-forming)